MLKKILLFLTTFALFLLSSVSVFQKINKVQAANSNIQIVRQDNSSIVKWKAKKHCKYKIYIKVSGNKVVKKVFRKKTKVILKNADKSKNVSVKLRYIYKNKKSKWFCKKSCVLAKIEKSGARGKNKSSKDTSSVQSSGNHNFESSEYFQTVISTASRNFKNCDYTPKRMLNKTFWFISHDSEWHGSPTYGRLFDINSKKEYEVSSHYIYISYRPLTSNVQLYNLNELHPDIAECIRQSDFYKEHKQSYYYVMQYSYYYKNSPFLENFSEISDSHRKRIDVVKNPEVLNYGISDDYEIFLVNCYDEIE